MTLTYETKRLFLRILDENFHTINFQREQLKNDLQYIRDRNMLRLWVFNKDDVEKIIGQVTFYNIVPFAF